MRKYPLATFHLLLWLWNISPPVQDSRALPLYWLPDSTFINGQSDKTDEYGRVIQRHYRQNVLDWIEHCVPAPTLNSTTADIDTLDFEQRVAAFFPVFAAHGWPQGTGRPPSNHLGLAGGQCRFNRPDPEHLNGLYRLIADITGWSPPVCPSAYATIAGRRINSSISIVHPQNNPGLTTFLETQKVFSYAFPYNHQINYTIFGNDWLP